MQTTTKSKADRRLTIQLILAVSIAVFGCLMIVAAFIVPPTGEIHPSVLTALGEMLTFAGAVMGIDYRYKWFNHKTRKGGGNEEDK